MHFKMERMARIVAVLNRRRGVISPCGRCRQILIDYYPGINDVVVDRQQSPAEVPEPVVVEIGKLLPYGYVWKRDRSFQPKI
jgi:cytidine deaminase